MGSISYSPGSISRPSGSISNGAGSISSPSTGTISTETGASFVFTDASIPFDQRITFARSTVGNRFNSSGVLTSTAINVARANANQDYNPSTLAARGFLIEAAATNLLLRSQEFDNASWAKTDITVTANDGAAPDGTTTADLLTEGVAGTSTCNQAVTITAGTTLTQSFFVKRSGATPVQWIKTVVLSAGGTTRAWFDIQNGIAGTLGPSAGTHTVIGRSITALPNGWYRISLTVTIATDTSATVVISSAAADNNNNRLNNATYQMWGSQYEANAFATSYIVTTTAATARGADLPQVATLSTIGYNSTQGSLSGEVMFEGVGSSSTRRIASFNDGTTDNEIAIVMADGGSDLIRLVVTSGGVTQADISSTVTAVANTTYKWCISWSANIFRISVNSTAGTEDTSGTVPTVDRLTIGTDGAGANSVNGWVPTLTYYPTQLSQAQMNGITA